MYGFAIKRRVVADRARPGYDIWLEDSALLDPIVDLLRRNPYFHQALELRQLAPPRIRRLPAGWPLKLSASLAALRGARLGDVKLPLLIVNIPPEEVASWLA